MQSRQPDNQNNIWMALLLSMAVFLAWQYFYAEPKMREERERQRAERVAKDEAAKTATLPAGTAIPSAQSGATGPAGAPSGLATATAGRSAIVRAADREQALALSPRIAIETPSLRGSIGLKGGRIDDLKLLKYREKVDPNSPNIVLFAPTEAPHAYFADYGWTGDPGVQIALPNRDTVWTSVGAASLTPTTPVVLVWDNGQGLTFKRTVSVDADYMFKVVDEVENKSGAPVTLRPFGRIFRDAEINEQANYILHEGLVGYIGEEGLKEFQYQSFAKEDLKREGIRKSFKDNVGGWLGATDKYWAAALVPDQKSKFTATFSVDQKRAATESDQFETRFETAPVALAPGAKAESASHLYAGAKRVTLIETYEEKLGIKKFNLMIDWGWFYFITKPLFHLMEAINGVLGNFGLTIIAVTLLVKAAFFPLASKSYESMAKMKKLQPEMEKLKERFKDDKERQSKELMALYQKEKINPLAGCLPVLLQIPVFFGLYKVLYGTIDMRHAPFFGWIKDLSAPDPTSLFNLFGLIPIDLPSALMIGIWPLLMGVTMWLQMQMNPPQPDPVQQQVFAWMPILFTFMLGSFPAGLVIYWAVNNVLSMGQQAYIMKQQGADLPLKDNIARQWADVKSVFASLSGRSAAPAAGSATKPAAKDETKS
jgi:YidC/Oxa1 family membrane protein insertase